MGVHKMLSMGVSDTECLNKSGIIEFQRRFSEDDLVEGEMISFFNALDEGYRCTVALLKAECHLTIQLDFTQSDRKFGAIE